MKPVVLVVEDEYFLGDDCAALLRKTGFDVVGPVADLNDAFAKLDGIHGAIVDINLAGTAVYPLVDELLKRKIPVVFYTGYDQPDPKYADVPHFQKPHFCNAAVKALRDRIIGRFF